MVQSHGIEYFEQKFRVQGEARSRSGENSQLCAFGNRKGQYGPYVPGPKVLNDVTQNPRLAVLTLSSTYSILDSLLDDSGFYPACVIFAEHNLFIDNIEGVPEPRVVTGQCFNCLENRISRKSRKWRWTSRAKTWTEKKIYCARRPDVGAHLMSNRTSASPGPNEYVSMAWVTIATVVLQTVFQTIYQPRETLQTRSL